jgi:iron complex transport system ATP-binding protein
MGNNPKQKILRAVLMMNKTEILSLGSLKIGYVSGKETTILLPPLDARAYKGELIGIIGRNGIGKSTLLRTITGLQQPLGGSVSYSGKDIHDFSRIDLAQKVGFISTEVVKVSNMTVYDLVSIGRYPYTNWLGKIDTRNHEIIMKSIEMTSMSAFCNKYIGELSDGERQKAMIARILAQDTDIMIMDEPTAFLDIASKYEILHLMHQLTRLSGKTIIFSTHDLQMAISQSDKIWLILESQLKEGAPEDLMINGDFEYLFESSSVNINSVDGSFSFVAEDRAKIHLKGGGMVRHWTEEALKRSGYTLTGEKSFPYIELPDTDDKVWKVVDHDKTYLFYSVYDLLNHLT